MGRLAGALALQLGKRPTELLGISESPYEDLLLDLAIINKVLPNQEERLLKDEIAEKRKRLMYRYFG